VSTVVEFLLTQTLLGLKRRVSIVLLGLLFIPCFGQTPGSVRGLLFDFQLDHAKELIRSSDFSIEKLELESLYDILSLLSDQSTASYEVYEKKNRKLIKSLKRDLDSKSYSSSSFLFKHYFFAAIASSQFSDYPAAGKSILQAYKYYGRMKEQHPAHPESKLAGAIISILSEQVPDKYAKFVPKGMASPEGSSGFKQIHEVYKKATLSNSDLALEAGLLWVLLLWEFSSDSEELWSAWMEVKNNSSIAGLLSSEYVGIMTAFKTGHRDYLNTTFSSLQKSDMDRLKYLYFQRGKHLIFAFDPEGLTDLQTFVDSSPKGNFVKTAWLRKGWYYLVNHNDTEALDCFSKVETEGYDAVYSDKHSLKEAQSANLYDPHLLRFRMMYDGGSYVKCIEAIDNFIGQKSSEDIEFLAEKQYRKARCLQGLHRNTESLNAFDLLLNKYSEAKSYIIPQSAILASNIAEKNGDIRAAKDYLNIAEENNKYGFQKTFERQIQSIRRRLNR